MSASEASAAPHHGRIVVGVDGSPISKAALRWATNQARLTGATVHAVIAWQVPESMTGHAWAALHADRAEQHPGERAVPAAAHHEQRRLLRRLHQGL